MVRRLERLPKVDLQFYWRALCRRAPSDIPLFLLAITTMVGYIVAPLPDLARDRALEIVPGLLCCFLLSRWPLGQRQVERIWQALIAGAALLSFVGPLGMLPQHHWLLMRLPDRLQGLNRISGAFNPNVIAGAAVLLAPFAATRALAPSPGKGVLHQIDRSLSGLVLLALVSTLWLTLSRGGYVALAVSSLVLLGLAKPRWIRWWAVGLAAAALGVSFVVDWHSILTLLMEGEATVGMDVRLEIWSRAIYIISDFPFTGVGLGCFERVVEILYPLFLVPAGTVSHAHNLYLQVGVEFGLLGLVAYLSLWGLNIYLSVLASTTQTKSALDEHMRWLPRACAASLVGMAVHGVIDCAAWGNAGAIIPWVIMGVSIAVYRLYEQIDQERA